MRPLSSQFAPNALTTLDAFMKQAKKTRVFRRAQAVRQVVDGHTVKATADTFHFTNSALRKWVKRFAREGTQGLLDCPRLGRPRTITDEVEACIHCLFEQAPLTHGARSSQWNCRELSQAVSEQTGVPVHRESVRVALKKGLSDYRPTGRLDPDPYELAQARVKLAELQEQARQNRLVASRSALLPASSSSVSTSNQPSRAAHLRVQLVARSASNFTGSAHPVAH